MITKPVVRVKYIKGIDAFYVQATRRLKWFPWFPSNAWQYIQLSSDKERYMGFSEITYIDRDHWFADIADALTYAKAAETFFICDDKLNTMRDNRVSNKMKVWREQHKDSNIRITGI